MESGTVIHYVLQQVTSQYPGKALCGLPEEECRRLVRRTLDDYLQEAMGGEPDKTARFKYLFTRMANTLVQAHRIWPWSLRFVFCARWPQTGHAKDSSVPPLD